VNVVVIAKGAAIDAEPPGVVVLAVVMITIADADLNWTVSYEYRKIYNQ
jgi:hypothetical protein